MIRRQLSMAGMFVLGVAGGAVALIATFYVGYAAYIQTDTPLLLAFAALTLAPALGMWFTKNRYLRGTAVGLAAAFFGVTYVVWVWHPWTTMDGEEIARAEAEAIASGKPAFYLGDEVDGYHLNAYHLAPDQANFLYGECHPDPEPPAEGGCTDWDVWINTSWRHLTIGGDAIAPCVRQEPVAGVPTVHLPDRLPEYDEVALFTGHSQVSISFAGEPSLEQKLRILRRVRPVGEFEAAASLPPPTPRIRAYVETHCPTTR